MTNEHLSRQYHSEIPVPSTSTERGASPVRLSMRQQGELIHSMYPSILTMSREDGVRVRRREPRKWSLSIRHMQSHPSISALGKTPPPTRSGPFPFRSWMVRRVMGACQGVGSLGGIARKVADTPHSESHELHCRLWYSIHPHQVFRAQVLSTARRMGVDQGETAISMVPLGLSSPPNNPGKDTNDSR